MKVLIIEDEQPAAKRLEEIILSIIPDAEIPAILDTVRDSVKWLKGFSADLIFMDIHLSDGNSFEIFEKVQMLTPVVFTTAYNDYAIRAFKVNSVDYLMKPFSREDVARAIEKYRGFFRTGNFDPDMESLIRMMKPGREYQKRFLVTAGARLKSIQVEDVAYFYSLEKNTFICTRNNHQYPFEFSLDKLEMLVEPENFFRINRNFLVSYTSIKNMYSLSKSRIKLELTPPPEDETLVSFNKSHEFRVWLGK